MGVEIAECKRCEYYCNYLKAGYGYVHYCKLVKKPIRIIKIEGTNFYRPELPCEEGRFC